MVGQQLRLTRSQMQARLRAQERRVARRDYWRPRWGRNSLGRAVEADVGVRPDGHLMMMIGPLQVLGVGSTMQV